MDLFLFTAHWPSWFSPILNYLWFIPFFCFARYRLHWKIMKSWSRISSVCTSSCNFDTPDLNIRPHLSRRKEYGFYDPKQNNCSLCMKGFFFTDKTHFHTNHSVDICALRVLLSCIMDIFVSNWRMSFFFFFFCVCWRHGCREESQEWDLITGFGSSGPAECQSWQSETHTHTHTHTATHSHTLLHLYTCEGLTVTQCDPPSRIAPKPQSPQIRG